MATPRKFVRMCLLLTLVMVPCFNRSSGQSAPAAGSIENAKIASRIESFKSLSPEAKEKVSQDLQRESKEHYGFGRCPEFR